MKEEKTYTIKYSKSGILQYADFKYKEGKLVYHNFRPSYAKITDVPSLENLNEIEDILEVIKKFSYANRAEIYLINGRYPELYQHPTIDKSLEKADETYSNFVGKLTTDFFKKELLPLIRKNKWKVSYSWMGMPVLIKKVKGEWDNIDSNHRDAKIIDFICNKFINNILRLDEKLDLRSEHGYSSSDSFPIFLRYIPEKELEDLNILIKTTN